MEIIWKKQNAGRGEMYDNGGNIIPVGALDSGGKMLYGDRQ